MVIHLRFFYLPRNYTQFCQFICQTPSHWSTLKCDKENLFCIFISSYLSISTPHISQHLNTFHSFPIYPICDSSCCHIIFFFYSIINLFRFFIVFILIQNIPLLISLFFPLNSSILASLSSLFTYVILSYLIFLINAQHYQCITR